MATAYLTVKNGRITNASDRYLEHLAPDGSRYIGNNGWEAYVVPPKEASRGTVVCHAEKNYGDEIVSRHYEFKLADGQIGLSGGHISERYAFFRAEKFVHWMEEHGVTSVKRRSPNGEFTVRDANYEEGKCHGFVLTDGRIEIVKVDYGRTDQWQNELSADGSRESYECDTTYRVADATWTIVDQATYEGKRHAHTAVLFSLAKEIMSLNLPKKQA